MPSVERLEAALRECVAERQALHEEGAGRAELEENRLELVRLQSQLSRDLIYRRMGVTGRSRSQVLHSCRPPRLTAAVIRKRKPSKVVMPAIAGGL
jgi:hypothetical protein